MKANHPIIHEENDVQTAECETPMRKRSGEPISAAGAAMKCGAALAILILLIVIGRSVDDTLAPDVSGARPAASAATAPPARLAVDQPHGFSTASVGP